MSTVSLRDDAIRKLIQRAIDENTSVGTSPMTSPVLLGSLEEDILVMVRSILDDAGVPRPVDPVAMPHDCPGCSSGTGVPHGDVPGVFTCAGCGGVVGRCDYEVSLTLVADRWHEGPGGDETYYDLSGNDARTGRPYRRHGWYSASTRGITQTG